MRWRDNGAGGLDRRILSVHSKVGCSNVVRLNDILLNAVLAKWNVCASNVSSGGVFAIIVSK